MSKPNNTRLCASAAIAAALALAHSPLLAQQSAAPTGAPPDPVLIVPEIAPTSPPPLQQPQPTIVVPSELPAPATDTAQAADEPVSQAEADGTTPIPAESEQEAPRELAAPHSPASVALPAEGETAEPEAAVPVRIDTPERSALPISPAAEPLSPPTPAGASDATNLWVAVLAGLVAVALAIWGFIAIGRRRPINRKAAPLAKRPTVTPSEPVSEPTVIDTTTVTPLATARTRTPTPAPSLAHTGAAVPLPGRMPQTYAERDTLLKRMVAAKPDRANPFTTKRARLKRARLILQSLGHDFGDREPWIDLSQYPSNWPELARRKHVAA